MYLQYFHRLHKDMQLCTLTNVIGVVEDAMKFPFNANLYVKLAFDFVESPTTVGMPNSC